MVKKTSMAWFEPDNYRYFYTDGILNELNQKINATSDLTLKNEYSKQILNIDGMSFFWKNLPGHACRSSWQSQTGRHSRTAR